MTINQVLAMWVLEIWNPDKLNFLSGTRKRQATVLPSKRCRPA